jgi:hypothetical protein
MNDQRLPQDYMCHFCSIGCAWKEDIQCVKSREGCINNLTNHMHFLIFSFVTSKIIISFIRYGAAALRYAIYDL